MEIIKPSKNGKNILNLQINCINYNFVNKYTLSNFFLHPTRPTIQTNRILLNLKNISFFYKLKLRIKFYISLLKTLFNIFKVNNEKIILENKKKFIKKNMMLFLFHIL